MRFISAFMTALVLCFGLSVFAQSFPAIDREIIRYDTAIASKEAAFARTPSDVHSVSWVKAKLAHMFDIDQYMRNFWREKLNRYEGAELKYFQLAFLSRFEKMDRQCTADIQELLKIYDWFKISVFGAVADDQAWLIVQHADLQPEFQKSVLVLLERLYPLGETKPANYAYLYDRVATNAPTPGQLQRYGTQGKCVGPGQWEPNPIEIPEKVDERRASVGLGTMAEYKKAFTFCK
jgi:hypothetical protein